MSINLRNYQTVKADISNKANLLVVSKHQSIEDIEEYYKLGQRDFGENRSQELLTKINLHDDINWHFIGHLQQNKIKQVIPYVKVIESLDSIELAKAIESYCCKHNYFIKAYAEFHLAENDLNKTGLSKEEAFSFFEACSSLKHIKLDGIMVMGPHTDNEEEIHDVFKEAYALYHSLKVKYHISTLSMGMSADYKIALEEGSTEVRIGTFLFKKEEN